MTLRDTSSLQSISLLPSVSYNYSGSHRAEIAGDRSGAFYLYQRQLLRNFTRRSTIFKREVCGAAASPHGCVSSYAGRRRALENPWRRAKLFGGSPPGLIRGQPLPPCPNPSVPPLSKYFISHQPLGRSGQPFCRLRASPEKGEDLGQGKEELAVQCQGSIRLCWLIGNASAF